MQNTLKSLKTYSFRKVLSCVSLFVVSFARNLVNPLLDTLENTLVETLVEYLSDHSRKCSR
jgi:hypothetical protein